MIRARALSLLGPPIAAVALVALLVPPAKTRESWYEQAHADQPALLAALQKRQSLRRERDEFRIAWRKIDLRERARDLRVPAVTALTFRFAADLPAGPRASVERAVRGELAALGDGAPHHAIAVSAYMDPEGGYSRSVVLPSDPTDPCTIVIGFFTRGATEATIPATDRVLGTCAFHAAFGAPGAGMHAWLLATNLRRAGYLQPPAAIVGDTATLRPGYMSLNGEGEFLACRAGRLDGGDAVFDATDGGAFVGFPPSWWEEYVRRDLAPTPEIHTYSSTSLSGEAAPLFTGMLGALADSLGRERFATIWRSANSPAVEYERQAGRPLSAWVERHLATRMAPYHAGPGVPRFQAMLALVLVAVAAAIAISRTRRVMS